jgi:hypothetical protein
MQCPDQPQALLKCCRYLKDKGLKMLTGLQEEITSRVDLATASKERILQLLNEDGSALTETWQLIPIAEQTIKLSKLALLTRLTKAQRAGIRAMLEGTSEDEKDFQMLYNSDDEFWVNDLTFRETLDTLAVILSIDAGVVTAIKRLGERKISRAEELFNRKITMEDFE